MHSLFKVFQDELIRDLLFWSQVASDGIFDIELLNNLLNFVSRCYLEFYFCFTKTEIKFMSLQAKSRGLTERASIPQMLLRNLIQEMV